MLSGTYKIYEELPMLFNDNERMMTFDETYL